MYKIRTLSPSLLLLSFMLVCTGTAVADQACKLVAVKVKNLFSNGNNQLKIKVLAVNYYDYEDAKWRTDNLTNFEVNYGASEHHIETLEYVGNEWVQKMQVKFKFKEDTGWSSAEWSNVTKFDEHSCYKYRTYLLIVTSTTEKKK